MDTALASASPDGSYCMEAASPSAIPLVGMTLTVLDVRRATCSATAMMFLLFGSRMTAFAGHASTAWSN